MRDLHPRRGDLHRERVRTAPLALLLPRLNACREGAPAPVEFSQPPRTLALRWAGAYTVGSTRSIMGRSMAPPSRYYPGVCI